MTRPSAPSAPAALQLTLARTLARAGAAQGRPDLTARAGQLAPKPAELRRQAAALTREAAQLLASDPEGAQTLALSAQRKSELAALQEALKG